MFFLVGPQQVKISLNSNKFFSIKEKLVENQQVILEPCNALKLFKMIASKCHSK
jgi:hypothetical protein